MAKKKDTDKEILIIKATLYDLILSLNQTQNKIRILERHLSERIKIKNKEHESESQKKK